MKIFVFCIIIILTAICFFGLGTFCIWKIADEALKNQDNQTVRATAYYNVLNQWLKDLHEGKDISEYFVRNHYQTVAIYGYAELGMRLAEELQKSSDIQVSYIIDKNAQNVASEVEVYQPGKDLPKVDVIVVTPVHIYAVIDKMLKELVPYTVVSLEDVIYDI